MEQLSGSDNIFLFSEQNNVYNHVASLIVYDVSTAPGGKVRYKDILRHFEDRMHLHPVFHRRLAKVPFGIDRPYWVAESDIDVEFHIRHIALPKPGDWRQLMIQVARLHSRPLDRSRPLWEAYVIEGLDNIPKLPLGSFAMFMKFHHASVDGLAGIHLATQLLSPTPDTAGPGGDRKTVYLDRIPSAVEYVSRAVTNTVSRVQEIGRLSARLANTVRELGVEQIGGIFRGESGAGADAVKPAWGRAPETRFNKSVSANRVVDGFGMPLSRIKRVRASVEGATLNDIFLAVSGGAVRKYLLAKNELPAASLIALMPMALRSDGSAGGNAVGAGTVRVRSDVGDPIARLKVAHSEAAAGKQQAEQLGTDLFKNILDNVPSALGNLILTKLFIPTINMTVSNVRGPDQPLYMAGAKAMCFYPVSIPSDGVGLNITGVSYNGVMWVSVVSCRNMVPDPGFFNACMKEAWDELLAAADALPQRVAALPARAIGKAKRPSATKQPAAGKPKADVTAGTARKTRRTGKVATARATAVAAAATPKARTAAAGKRRARAA